MFWDNDIYRKIFSYKIQQGLQLAAMVKPVRGKLLELGSETGILSYELYKMGYTIEGVDFDYKLVDMARKTTAKSVFFESFVDDIMLYENQYPMVIANDMIHRIPEEFQTGFLDNVYNSMTGGGEWAFNMGTKGNNLQIENALADAFAQEGLEYSGYYFPASDEYAQLLKDTGFEIAMMTTFQKPEKISGHDAMSHFINMFRRSAFKKLSPEQTESIISNACHSLEDSLFDGTSWTIPYVRTLGKVIKAE